MLELAQWLSDTRISWQFDSAIGSFRCCDEFTSWAFAMVVSSVFLIDLRILQITRSQSRGDGA